MLPRSIGPSQPRILRGLLLVSALALLALALGCSRRPSPTVEPQPVFDEVRARRAGFEGFQARAVLTLEHKADRLILPLDITVTDDLAIEARGEISHFLLPFEGEVRLLSEEGSTLLDTNIGTYDLGIDPGAQAGLRAFLLSLAGGGDWLVWWLAGRGCLARPETECMDLEIDLEQDAHLPSIRRWKISERSAKASFAGEVEQYDPDTLFPRIMRGVIQPQEISVYLKYTDVSVIPGKAE